MLESHLARHMKDRSVWEPKEDSNKTKGRLGKPSGWHESNAVCQKGRWTLDSGNGKSLLTCPKKQILFSQGDAADAVFYIQAGKVKLTVVSLQGKEAVVAILGNGAFLGESCLAGQTVRTATATALEDSTLVRIDNGAMIRMLHEEPTFAEQFMSYLLAHTIRVQEDLVDQLFNSSEKRLARVLLSMAHFGDEGKTEAVIPKISQEMLAEMIGTTRSRVSFFMNRFRKLGFIEYGGVLRVRSSLLNVVSHDLVFPIRSNT